MALLNARLLTKDNLTHRIATQVASQMCEGGCELPKNHKSYVFRVSYVWTSVCGYLGLIESLLSSIK